MPNMDFTNNFTNDMKQNMYIKENLLNNFVLLHIIKYKWKFINYVIVLPVFLILCGMFIIYGYIKNGKVDQMTKY